MEFLIRQGASDPILKLRMIDDAKNDKTSFNDLLENADITFDMYEYGTENPVILNATCNITTRTKKFQNTNDEYYIIYRFTENQTSQKGRFEGIVTIQFLDENSYPTTKLILPIKEKLFVNII
jgi:hypothetical protein